MNAPSFVFLIIDRLTGPCEVSAIAGNHDVEINIAVTQEIKYKYIVWLCFLMACKNHQYRNQNVKRVAGSSVNQFQCFVWDNKPRVNESRFTSKLNGNGFIIATIGINHRIIIKPIPEISIGHMSHLGECQRLVWIRYNW